MKSIVVTLILLGAVTANASSQFPSPYAGEEFNKIKSLTPGEVSGLLQGKDMAPENILFEAFSILTLSVAAVIITRMNRS